MSFLPKAVAGPQYRLHLALAVLLLSLLGLYRLSGETTTVVVQAPVTNVHRQTALQRDPPPDKPPYGSIVIAANANVNLGWTVFLQSEWKVYAYDVDEPENPDLRLRFPRSKGHEAMVYLSYIIDNYDDLPWAAVFIHGHLDAVWHQEANMLRILQNLNRIALARQGYISLRCEWYPSCPTEVKPTVAEAIIWGSEALLKASQTAIKGNWHLLFPEEPLPAELAAPCCAQFAATRQAIQRRRKVDYERIRNWLLDSPLEDDVSGRVLEKLWAYIFLGEAVHCPPVDVCACEWFGRCGTNNEPKWQHFQKN